MGFGLGSVGFGLGSVGVGVVLDTLEFKPESGELANGVVELTLLEDMVLFGWDVGSLLGGGAGVSGLADGVEDGADGGGSTAVARLMSCFQTDTTSV